MYDELLSVLAQARINAMLREAAHYRAIVESRSIPKSRPSSIDQLRRGVASVLHYSAEAIEPKESACY